MTLERQATVSRRGPDPLIDPSNFTVERLPGLAIVFEQFAEALAENLAPLAPSASFSMEKIRSATLFSVLEENQGDLAGVLHCRDLDARALTIANRGFVDALAHSAFGGKENGGAAANGSAPRPFTRIEMQLVEWVARAAASALARSLAGVADAPFSFERLETLDNTPILGRRDAPVVIAHLLFETLGASGRFIALLPQAMLLPLRQKLSRDPAAEATVVDPRWARQMEAGVSSTRIPVNGVLEEFEMTLGEVADLSVGRVLALRDSGSGRVRLESGGHNLFWCKLAQVDGRYTLEVAEPIEQEKGLLEQMMTN